MPYPSYVPTRAVSVGGSMSLEGAEALRIKVSVTSTRSLVWDASGYRFDSLRTSVTSEPGAEASLLLPRTDVSGWRDGRTGELVVVDSPDTHTHTYNALIEFLTEAGTSAGIPPVKRDGWVLPEGDGSPVDLDKTIPVGTVSGQVVSIPDSWSLLVQAAEQSAADAAAALASIGTPSVTATPDSIPKRTASGAVAVAAPTSDSHATTLGSVRATRTGKTTATPGRSAEVLAPEFVATGGDLLTHAALGMPSIATMRVMCTDGIVTSPLGRFYAYISTDHDTAGTPEPWNGKGGVVLAYADSPTGPWTAYRNGSGQLIVWQDTVVGNQTETPTPLYVPEDPAGKPIYVYYQNQGAGLNQSTLLARSATGRPEDFERVGIVVQGRGTTNPVWPGDGQSTYLEPMRYDGQIIAVHLIGGGDWAQYGRSYSQDGRNFVTDPRRYGHFSHLVGADNGRRVSIRSLFRWRGQPWAVVTIGNHTSGFVTAPRQVGLVRLSTDLRRIVGRVHTLADASIGAGVVLEHEGRLYMYYRSGDAYSAFRVAVAEG